MAYRRMLTKQGTLLQRWYCPSLSHIVDHGDDSDKSFKSPSSSRSAFGSNNSIFLWIHNGSSIGGIGGFGACSGWSKCFLTFFFPAGAGLSLSRYMSSTTGEGFDAAGHVDEIADILTDKTVEAVSSQVPAINEVAVAAADSAFPVAALQYLIDAVHTLTGLNWWAAIAITTILIRGVMLPFDINEIKAAYKLGIWHMDINRLTNAEAHKLNSMMGEILKQNIVDLLRGPTIHGSIFIIFCFAISNMVEKVPSLKNGGVFWFTDLTSPDTLYILPVLASLLFLVDVECNMLRGLKGIALAGQLQVVSRTIAVIAVPFTVEFSKAFFCYWLTSELITFSYAFALKRPEVRTFLGLHRAHISPFSTHTSQSQTESSSPSAYQQQNTAKEPKQSSESSKVADRRIKNQEQLEGNKERNQKKQM